MNPSAAPQTQPDRSPTASFPHDVVGAVARPWLQLADRLSHDIWMRDALLHTGYAHGFRAVAGLAGIGAGDLATAEIRAADHEGRARTYVELVGWREFTDVVRRLAPDLRPL
ncbi:hypothetical protein [Cellulomonas carbonis]|uniref:Uncharacterized protein n=1 Tax=Cellulomonas carbonis T26 TaxID=947969 RepID=A0A0A0BU13_9CELL|nr:hypothetical protein [Cellulomonas carbonis]KGM11455.1 hypothetical protein N868_08850 [Cellulomonas carbonis T26]GGC10625.1 hypothetical protein GCM10010972_24890 [Cellulomonas carbonis]